MKSGFDRSFWKHILTRRDDRIVHKFFNLKIAASDQGEKVLEALRSSLGKNLGKNGNMESDACAVKKRAKNTYQLSLSIMLTEKTRNEKLVYYELIA